MELVVVLVHKNLNLGYSDARIKLCEKKKGNKHLLYQQTKGSYVFIYFESSVSFIAYSPIYNNLCS